MGNNYSTRATVNTTQTLKDAYYSKKKNGLCL